MVFDENYYKENNVPKTREDRMKHHSIEMRKAIHDPNYDCARNEKLFKIASEHYSEYYMLARRIKEVV